jgi:ElaA protein
VFQVADGLDPIAYHILGYDAEKDDVEKDDMDSDPKLVVYARMFGPGDKYEHPAISRVVCDKNYRSRGAGRELVGMAIEMCYTLYGHLPIPIGAQYYLKRFYEGFGFALTGGVTGDVYEEDGRDHVEMIKPFR